MNMLNNDYDNDHIAEPRSILIIHDNFDIVILMTRALKEHGFQVAAFTDLLLALEDFKVNRKDCSLILSDIRMTGMNGYEFK